VPDAQVLFKGEHLHTYQDWSWDETLTECNAGNAHLVTGAYLPVSYTVQIKQGSAVIDTLSGNLPANTGSYSAFKAFSIPWTPNSDQCGAFTAEITTQSSPAPSYGCTAQSKTTSAEKTFNIGANNDGDDYYDLCGDCDDTTPLGQHTYPTNPNQYCNCDNSDGKVKGNEICDIYDNDCDGQILTGWGMKVLRTARDDARKQTKRVNPDKSRIKR
jgi:hypothetical protein